jgi:serine/threonine protein kinase
VADDAAFFPDQRRVVVIDDDRVVLSMIARCLGRRGYDVRSYDDPRVAVEALAADQPLAVITDMQMPGLNGLQVVGEVKKRLGESAPPVLVVSSVDDQKILEESFQAGAVDYLIKPIKESELGAKLEKAIRHLGGLGNIRPPASIPKRIGAYDLLEPIGRGGTAAVFKARKDGDDSGDVYALKVVWPHLTVNPEALLRFRREIDVLSELDHPKLVGFVEAGRHDGCFYYVMEHLTGGTLRDRIERQGPGTTEDVLDMLTSLAEPLGYLHERGLVHRDLKPGNIFFDDKGTYILGDFGLAKREDDHGITLSEEFIGTPLYLAPEVFESDKFDHRVDLYALGVCAMEFLLGRPPLDERDPVRLIARIVNEGMPPVSELCPGLPVELEKLLSHLLARDPSQRTASARDLVEEAHQVDAALHRVD